MWRKVILRFLPLAILALNPAALHAQNPGEWRFYSGDNRARKYSPLDQINKDNVSKLKVAWRHPQLDPALLAANPQLRLSNRYMATPIMVNGVLYVANGLGLAEAIDPGSGKTLWTQKPLVSGPEGLPGGNVLKGLAYWSEGSEARILTIRAVIGSLPRAGRAAG